MQCPGSVAGSFISNVVKSCSLINCSLLRIYKEFKSAEVHKKRVIGKSV